MKITSSYSIEIKNADKIFRDTIDIYRSAMSMCISIFDTEWDYLKQFKKLEQVNKAKDLIHSTKSVVAKYPEYDNTFYKLPIHLLIAIIKTSLGIVESYHTKLDKGENVRLQIHTHKMPTFYKTVMCKGNILEDNEIALKLYHNKDWVWIKFKLKKTDINYIKNHCNTETMSCPTLQRKNKKWFLTFMFTEETTLTKNTDKILAIDLGLNTDAVCSVMLPDGTVIGRKFINFPSEKDYLKHTLNKIKKLQKKYNNHNLDKLWREVNFHNLELSKKITQAIVDYASSQEVDYIVFEYLDFKGKKSSQKITLWRKKDIQKRVEHKAHKLGIRISRVNPKNTSQLAFDGSGKVLRGKQGNFANDKLCKFTNGKIYNCDLNASYNIGARFYLRELSKTYQEIDKSCAKVEILCNKSRLLWTLDDLIKVS